MDILFTNSVGRCICIGTSWSTSRPLMWPAGGLVCNKRFLDLLALYRAPLGPPQRPEAFTWPQERSPNGPDRAVTSGSWAGAGSRSGAGMTVAAPSQGHFTIRKRKRNHGGRSTCRCHWDLQVHLHAPEFPSSPRLKMEIAGLDTKAHVKWQSSIVT